MNEPTITCPHCTNEIKLTESLAAPLIRATQLEYEAKILQKETDISQREAVLRHHQKTLEDAQNQLEEKISARLKAERITIAADEAKKAKLILTADLEEKSKQLAELQQVLHQRDLKLEEAQKAQANWLRKERELDDAKREMDLTIEKRVQASIMQVRQKAKQEVEDDLKLKVTEKEAQITSMQRQIDELKRKAEQGSQQLQGETLELELEAALRSAFSFDRIEPIAKGEFGGDVLQKIVNSNGQACGAILWETKRTKNWSDAWLAKLKGDQRTAKAEIAILVSNILPKNMETFCQLDGVWVVEWRLAIPLAIALRQSLIEIANVRQAQQGQETKMELIYSYLTGAKFRHRIEAIVEKFSDMQADLDKERKVMTRLWAKREIQIRGVIESTVGMYGDLQGIAGSVLPEIPGLELPLIAMDELDNER
ncbi:hypothetical protein W03_12440 [Nitrosomonas sp. PY1]|uniref:DUF2130 domain-containing protein n=1 Tax=Nitrosomonas sp. PY1 TaxID=1803906 RepID=UPI001FC86169|nr:DUF2130 domain-containing protein [Nitrosomonas sp. PY1]GKS69240.1 hypothetical protein W03_12440 [Nitrosomonas sp. PY1]